MYYVGSVFRVNDLSRCGQWVTSVVGGRAGVGRTLLDSWYVNF